MDQTRGNSLNVVFYAYGHPAIRCTHPTTLEITKDASLTRNGDCIVGVASTMSASDMPPMVKDLLSVSTSRARLVLEVDNHTFTVEGNGANGLSLTHPRDIVVRRSSFVSDRTLMVGSDKAAADIPRGLVQLLKDPDQRITLKLSTISDSDELPR